MSESTENQPTPEEIAEAITKRSLLEVWTHVLSNVERVGHEPIPVNAAASVVARWPWLTFQETARYHDLYHEVLGKVRDVLAQVVSDNPGCFEFTDELDLEHNGPLYLDLLVKWHSMLDTLETAWRAEDAESHLWVAVIPDVRAFVFSTNGLAGHLDQIGFALTNDEFVEALQKAATGE